MSSGLFAWPVESEPSRPTFIAWIMSRASPERHSPTTIRSGRMCRALRRRSRIVTSPSPSRFAGRASRVTMCSWWSWSSAASSIVTIRSSSGMNEEMTLSVVVLPEPVPPETKRLRWASTQTRRKSNISWVAVPNRTRSSTRYGVVGELADRDHRPHQRQGRDDRVHPRAVGEPGVDPRAGHVDPPAERGDDPVDDAQDVLVVQEGLGDPLELAAPLDVDLVRPVDHDLGDRAVAEERLQRAEALDLADQVVDDVAALGPGQGEAVGPEEVVDDRLDRGGDVGRGGIEQGDRDLADGILQAEPDVVEEVVPDRGRGERRARRRGGRDGVLAVLTRVPLLDLLDPLEQGHFRRLPRRARDAGQAESRPGRRYRARARWSARRGVPAMRRPCPPRRASRALPSADAGGRRVICSQCGTDNEAGRKFCVECAARLATGCPTCGTAEPADGEVLRRMRDPAGRGQRTAPGVGARRRPAPPATGEGRRRRPGRAPVAERRLVSVLFADLVGFTTLAEGRDAEDTRELLSRYFDLARDVIARYGGTVEKFIGDAVMAVWGAPTAREDDAERAVRAGLELVDAVRDARARDPGPGRRPDRRGGRHPRRHEPGDGRRRPRQHREPAPVAWPRRGRSSSARRPSGRPSRAIDFEPAGEQTLKGKAAPVPAWRAVRVVAEVGGRHRSESLEAPIRRPGRRAAPAQGPVPRHRPRATGPPVSRHRAGRDRQDPARLGVPQVHRRARRTRSGGTTAGARPTATGSASGPSARWSAAGAGLVETDDEATTRAKVAETLATHVPDPEERRWIEPALLALLGIETGAELRAAVRRLADVLRAAGRRAPRSSWCSRTSTSPTRACSTSSTTSWSGAGTSRSTS